MSQRTQPQQEATAMPRRAHPYGRTSFLTATNREESAKRQDDFAEEICTEEGWYLDDTYHFADAGKSGFHGDHLGPNGDLTRFLRMVRSGQVTPGSVIIIENLDRLSRQDVDLAYDVFRDLIKAGIWIATKQPRRVYKRENAGLMDLMEPIWLFYLAHEESAKKSMRIAHKWQTRREQARAERRPHGRTCPAWVEYTATGYQLRQKAADTIRLIFDLATKHGYGIVRIAAYLNARGIPAIGQRKSRDGTPHRRAANVWIREYIRKIIRSRATLGEYQPHRIIDRKPQPDGPPIAGYFPAAVDEQTWLLAQAALDGRRNCSGRPGHRVANLFTGIVYDSLSRQPMSIDSRSDRPSLVPARASGMKRRGTAIPYHQFERGVLARIGSLQLADILAPDSARTDRETAIHALTGRLVTLDHRAEQITQQLADPDNAAAVAALTKALTQIAAEKDQAAAQLQVLKLQSATGRGEALAEAQSVIAMLDAARDTPEEEPLRQRLKAALRWIIDEVWLILQPIGGQKYIGHAQIYLRSGAEPRYVQLLPANPKRPIIGRLQQLSPWQLDACDFRAGDIGEAAPHTAAPQLTNN